MASNIPDYVVALRTFLISPEKADRDRSQTALTQLAELVPAEKIHYQHVPQFSLTSSGECNPDDLKPYIWYNHGSVLKELALNCNTERPDSFTLNVEIYSTSPYESQEIERLIVKAVSDYGNPKTGSPFGDINVQDVLVSQQDDDYDPVGNNFALDVVWHIQIFQLDVYPLWDHCCEQIGFGYK